MADNFADVRKILETIIRGEDVDIRHAEYALEGLPKAELVFPTPCHLCDKLINSKDDLDWHGLGNCVEICDRCTGSGIEPKPDAKKEQPDETLMGLTRHIIKQNENDAAIILYGKFRETTEREKVRCRNICLDEYTYWRTGAKDEALVEFAAGGMGASANMLCRIIDPTQKKTGEGKKE